MESKTLDRFIGKYQLSKTLRFELIPQGKTKEHIEQKGLLQQDEHRAKAYKMVKKIIDRYHQHFIATALNNLALDGLQSYEELYHKKEKEEADKKNFESLKAGMRKQIGDAFNKSEASKVQEIWKVLFDKELIRKALPEFVTSEEDKKLLAEFKDFTTYFTGFHQNRANIYTHEEKATAVAFRLVHENLPKFLDNSRVFDWIQTEYPDLDLSAIEKELAPELQGTTLPEIFALSFFNHTLTQNGIDLYNAVLGGKTTEQQNKIRGLNEYINLYNQRRTAEAKKEGEKFRRVPQFKELYKQILSDRESISFLPETFENDSEVLSAIENFFATQLVHFEKDNRSISVFAELQKLLQELKEDDRSKIFVRNDLALTNISQNIFGDWQVIKNALEHYYTTTVNPLAVGKKLTKAYENGKEKWQKQSYYSIYEIEEALLAYSSEADVLKEKNLTAASRPLCNYFATFSKDEEGNNLFQRIETAYTAVKDLLNTDYPEEKNLAQDKTNVAAIKTFLDAIKNLLHFIKPLHPARLEGEKDERFYGAFIPLFDQLNLLTPLYNKTRNYLTRKPYSTEKVKLNFENSTLLDGWDANKETANTSVLLRKDGLYYLAVMDKKYNKVFEQMPEVAEGEKVFEKVVYKLLPGANKMLPKVFFSAKNIQYYNPSTELLENYKNETHKKGATFNLVHCHQLIDFFKASIARHQDWKNFNFQFSDTGSYADLSGFYREVEQQGYKITFHNLPESYINQLVDQGKLYLFQIYNKDFSPFSKGRPNLHTMYWKMVFHEGNLTNVVYKLNGQAEIFFRKKSLNYDEKTLREGHHAAALKDKFAYPIISNRRFAFDKYQFHVPITINFKSTGRDNVNAEVLSFLQHNPSVNIIGIDRGERHLLYLTLIDQKGNIKKQMSLNQIINSYRNKEGDMVNIKTDYQNKLHLKEEERLKARQGWGLIENIKELKEGYLSHVVHEIAKMMVEHNAIVVMEDLNFGFKRGRQKVEKQVYQKFEKMLIDKLNYLVFKDLTPDEPGGLLHALQLTGSYADFMKYKQKQCGFLFYVPAWNTSKIDPLTGFVDFLKPKYESIEKAQNFLTKFKSIRFNPHKQWFEFTFDYTDFTDKAEGSRTKWTVCSTNQPRFRWNPKAANGKGAQEAVNVTQVLEDLFSAHNIAYGSADNLVTAITVQSSADFYKTLLRAMATLLALRHNNGKAGTDEQDYILSPVEPFFDSRLADDSRPKDADANGAYHIAKKGLWVLQQINEREGDDWKNLKLAISNKQWLHFAQQ